MTINTPQNSTSNTSVWDSVKKPVCLAILFIVSSFIYYFIYDNYFQLKVESVIIETNAKDSLFDIGEDIKFHINIKTNGIKGRIKYFLFDAERGDPEKKFSESFIDVDSNKDYIFNSNLNSFSGGYHRICLKYKIETHKFYKFIDDIVSKKLPSVSQELDGIDGECIFSCMPSDWGDNLGNQYSLFIENRKVPKKLNEVVDNTSTNIFYVMRYEVSSPNYEEWAKSRGINTYQSDLIPAIVERDKIIDAPTYPALMVSWKHAEEYCESVGGRLPKISEWDLLKGIANAYGNSNDPIIDINALKEDGYDLFGINTNAVEWSFDSCNKNNKTKKTYGWGSFDAKPNKIDCLDFNTPFHKVGFRCIIPRDSMLNNLINFINKNQTQ